MESTLDAHAKPPAEIRAIYKSFHKADLNSLDSHPDLVQFDGSSSSPHSNVHLKRCLDLPPEIRQAFSNFLGNDQDIQNFSSAVYEVPSVPGLYIYPSLLPPSVQLELLNRLLHRDLCNPEHKTNVHMHYNIPYPPASESFFSSQSTTFSPLNPEIHKPISTNQFLNKKLRWTTLGGQYDWTQKTYPAGPPPPFPADIKSLIEDIFPMKAEAAIVNLYSPGDTLSLHRDVSEECGEPLVSISLGCEAIFMAGLEGEGRTAVMRLRSGDAVLMSGESRFAWHGVPKVLEGSCPGWMREWPAGEGEFEEWRGWMGGKRVNLNVRQMFG